MKHICRKTQNNKHRNKFHSNNMLSLQLDHVYYTHKPTFLHTYLYLHSRPTYLPRVVLKLLSFTSNTVKTLNYAHCFLVSTRMWLHSLSHSNSRKPPRELYKTLCALILYRFLCLKNKFSVKTPEMVQLCYDPVAHLLPPS